MQKEEKVFITEAVSWRCSLKGVLTEVKADTFENFLRKFVKLKIGMKLKNQT